MKKIITLIFLIFLWNVECAKAEFSEISFKDPESDWIEISTNLLPNSPIKVSDDSLITTILPNQITAQNYILIHFKSETEKSFTQNNILHIYTTKSGLTGTTEQLTLESNNQIIDAVCWQNSSPPQSEQQDMQELRSLNAITTCINSEEVSKNQSIAKMQQIWQILTRPTPGEANILKNSPPKAIITIQKRTEFSINLDGSDSYDPDNETLAYRWIFPSNEIIEKRNPNSYKFQKSGDYEISLTVTDTLGATDTETLQISVLPEQNQAITALLHQISTQNTPQPQTKPGENWWYCLLSLCIIGMLFLSRSSHYKPSAQTQHV